MKCWDYILGRAELPVGRWNATIRQRLRGTLWRLVFAAKLTRWRDRKWLGKPLGARGELAAERYLLGIGYIILFRGYEDRFGEIDLIAVDGETIVFVEVKPRTTDHAGDPAEAVDETKQLHLTKTGIGFLQWHRLTDYAARFDVVAILGSPILGAAEIRHYINAFEPTGEFQMFG